MSYRTAETDVVRLQDILKYIDFALEYSRNGLDDHQAAMATAYCITIIGEASNNLTGELLLKHKEIPWRDIIGMRHRIIHGYSKLNVNRLNEVVTAHLPQLRMQIQTLLDTLTK